MKLPYLLAWLGLTGVDQAQIAQPKNEAAHELRESHSPTAYKLLKAPGQSQDQELIMLAKAETAKDKKGKGREKYLRGETKVKEGKTAIDFDEASIEGRRRLPMGVAVTKTTPDHAYDLINLRLRWHPEMIQSTSNLETGQGK